jgi:hypothetical protein
MGYRAGDPTVEFEARVEKKLPKSYLVEHVHGERYFLPFSQIVGYPDLPEADQNGYRAFEVTKWWDGVKEPLND